MRLLFINSIQMFGGGEIWMLRALKGLKERGHYVSLICRPGTELEKRAREAGVDVKCIAIRGDFGPITIFKTWKFIRQHRIQLILTNMDKELRFGGIAAKLAGHCAVIPRRGIDYPLKNKIQYKFTYKWLADIVYANSVATKNALLRNAPWLNPDKIKVIYNGINPEPFMEPAGKDLRLEWSRDENARFIGFVGQLDERKGIHALIAAFAQVVKSSKRLHLVMAGEGPLLKEIEVFCKNERIEESVHLLGFRNDIKDLMKAFHCLVLPSLWEGFGIVLIEAMAAARPCITTQTSSMPEIVEHDKTGLVVPVNDVDALASAMMIICTNDDLLVTWGENGRARVLKMFTIDKMLDQVEALFMRAIEKIK